MLKAEHKKNILKILLLVAVLVIIYFSYKMFTKSSFGFGAQDDYLWPDPANGNTLYSQEPVSPETGTIFGVEELIYKPGSVTCYNRILSTGWTSSASVQAIPLTALNNPDAKGGSAKNELEMFQNFMNYQPNVKAFMRNDTPVTPVVVKASDKTSPKTYTVDTTNTALKLFNDLVLANGGPVRVGSVSITKDTGFGGTTTSQVLTISLNQAVSIPKSTLPTTDPKYLPYMKARMNIIVGVLNALHFIYSPALLQTKKTPNYTSPSTSTLSTKSTDDGYTPTPYGGGLGQNGYVGIIEELFNNYLVDQPDSSTLRVATYDDAYNGVRLALTPNAKRAVWTYLYARDQWIDKQLEGFLKPDTSVNIIDTL